MSELRYNPILRDWTMVADNRQMRPDMPKGLCPFCPGSSLVPNDYDVLSYDNDFPVLSPDPVFVSQPTAPLYRAAEAYGKCEVVLYSSNHAVALSRLPHPQLLRVVQLWQERYVALSEDVRHEYILIFENRGREVGATISHPHGQIYAYPYLPSKIRTELESAEQHYQVTGRCLICDINDAERTEALRIVAENARFVAYIPYFTDFPYGVWISPVNHVPDIRRMTADDVDSLALILGQVTRGMDALYDRDFPYMMVIHQTPPHRPDVEDYYHFHIEFYPPLRTRDKVKYLASSETGAGAAANPASVEQTSWHLRQTIQMVDDEGAHK